MRKTSNNPLALDPYYTRGHDEKYLYKKDTVYAGKLVSYFSVMLFVAVDFACLISSWTAVQNENEWLVMLISFVCAVALDVPMAIAAIATKEGYQRLRGKGEVIAIVTLCIVCFLIIWGFQIGFRLETRNVTFSENAATIKNTLDTTAASTASSGDSKMVLYAALFVAVLPLCTSIASFVITYFGYDPLGARIYKREKVLTGIDARIIETEQALSEVGSTKEHMEFLLSYEKDCLDAHLMQIQAQGNLLKQVVRNIVMKKLSTPEQVAVVQRSGNELNENADDMEAPAASSNFLLNDRTEELS